MKNTGLTAREKQILTLIVEEYSSVEISEKLDISLRTVETHRKNIIKKTGARNIVSLVKYALRHKLYTDD